MTSTPSIHPQSSHDITLPTGERLGVLHIYQGRPHIFQAAPQIHPAMARPAVLEQAAAANLIDPADEILFWETSASPKAGLNWLALAMNADPFVNAHFADGGPGPAEAEQFKIIEDDALPDHAKYYALLDLFAAFQAAMPEQPPAPARPSLAHRRRLDPVTDIIAPDGGLLGTLRGADFTWSAFPPPLPADLVQDYVREHIDAALADLRFHDAPAALPAADAVWHTPQGKPRLGANVTTG